MLLGVCMYALPSYEVPYTLKLSFGKDFSENIWLLYKAILKIIYFFIMYLCSEEHHITLNTFLFLSIVNDSKTTGKLVSHKNGWM